MMYTYIHSYLLTPPPRNVCFDMLYDLNVGDIFVVKYIHKCLYCCFLSVYYDNFNVTE